MSATKATRGKKNQVNPFGKINQFMPDFIKKKWEQKNFQFQKMSSIGENKLHPINGETKNHPQE
jgi:hypothetical protein